MTLTKHEAFAGGVCLATLFGAVGENVNQVAGSLGLSAIVAGTLVYSVACCHHRKEPHR